MDNDGTHTPVSKIEDKRFAADADNYVLTLYVAGQTPRSVNAILNIRQICERELKDRYTLEIIDIYQHPGTARDEQLFALPTLIKRLPSPISKIIGDLVDTDKVLVGLNLREKKY